MTTAPPMQPAPSRAHTLVPDDWARLPEHLGIVVTRGQVPTHLPRAARPFPELQHTHEAVLVRFPTGGGLLVRGGTRVTVEWDERTEPDADPSWMVQGWAVTLAALQRGMLSLHAATVQVGASVVAIAGAQGAGKSTTAMGLQARGHRLLVDDVTLVEMRDGGAWTIPFRRNVHLTTEAAQRLKIEASDLPRLAGGRQKLAWHPSEPSSAPVRLDHLVVLSPHGSPGGATRLVQLRGAARLAALIEHTSRQGIAELILGADEHFRQSAALADAVPMHRVDRPHTGWSLESVLDLIEDLAGGPRGSVAQLPPDLGHGVEAHA